MRMVRSDRTHRIRSRGLRSALITGVVATSVAVASQASAQENEGWVTPAGSVDHTRTAAKPLKNDTLAPVFRLPALGIPNISEWTEIDGDASPEFLIVNGGRAYAHDYLGQRLWSSPPLELAAPSAVDITGDQRPELVMQREMRGFAVIRGRDGVLLWTSEDLGLPGTPIFADFNLDGVTDVLLPEFDCGSSSRGVGRGFAYSFADDPQNPTLLFALEEGVRDYHCQRMMAAMDLDGDQRPEVIAVGSEKVHVFSGETGKLTQSATIKLLPSAYGSLFVQDSDNDGKDELFLVSNNSRTGPGGTQAEGSRMAAQLKLNEQGELVVGWEVSVEDLPNDRHSWPLRPVVDVDGDANSEFVHSFFDNTTDEWTTFVRSANSGEVQASFQGRAVAALELALGGMPSILAQEGAGQDLTIYRKMTDGSWQSTGTIPGTFVLASSQGINRAGREGFRYHYDRSTNRIFTLTSRNAAGESLPDLQVNHIDLSTGQTLATFTYPREGHFVSGFTSTDDEVFATIEVDSGKTTFLDSTFTPLPNQNQLFAPAREAFYPVMGVYDDANDRLLLGREQTVYDTTASSPTDFAVKKNFPLPLLGLVENATTNSWMWIGYNRDELAEVPSLAGMDPVDGSYLWRKDGLVISSDEQQVTFANPQLVSDMNGDGTADIGVQLDDMTANQGYLYPASGLSGENLWPMRHKWPTTLAGSGFTSSPISLSTATDQAMGMLYSGQMYTISNGGSSVNGPSAVTTEASALIAFAPQGSTEDYAYTNGYFRAKWAAFDTNATAVWNNEEELLKEQDDDPTPPWTGTGPTLLHGMTNSYFVQGRSVERTWNHNLLVLDAANGAILHKLLLENGQVQPAGGVAEVSINSGVGFSAAGGTNAMYVTSSSDGWLYLLDLEADKTAADYPANMLRRSWNLGDSLAAVSAVDVNNDGFSELIVPVLSGEVIILGAPDEKIQLEVLDTNCVDPATDIDVTSQLTTYCVAWSVTSTEASPTSFAVTVVDETTGVSVAGPIRVDDAMQLQLDNLLLVPGRRYFARVQGFDGQGVLATVSGIFRSDGLLTEAEVAPPTITNLSAMPQTFMPGEGQTQIEATLFDASFLASYVLTITSDETAEEVFRVEELLNEQDYLLSQIWDGTNAMGEPLPLGSYTVTLTATDFDGEQAMESIAVTLGEPMVGMDMGPDMSGETDMGMGGAIQGGVEDESCACRSTGGRNAGGQPVALLTLSALLGGILLRRRRSLS